MRALRLITIGLALLLAIGLAVTLRAEPPTMKMTTEIPPGIATPDTVETSLGTLKLFDGVPDQATAQKVYDSLDFQRGVADVLVYDQNPLEDVAIVEDHENHLKIVVKDGKTFKNTL